MLEGDDQGAPAPPTLEPRPTWLTRHDDDPRYGWARTAWDRCANLPGARFVPELADHAIAVWPRYFRLTEDRFAGVPFRPNDWQEVVIRLLAGWLLETDITDPATGSARKIWVRIFQELRLWIPRKNGKSEFLASLALYFFALDGVMRGQGYVFARHEAQAKIVLTKMQDMIGYSDELRAGIQVYSKSIYIQRLKSGFEVLSGADVGVHGKSASVIVGDEIHEWRTLDLKNALRQSSGARLEPMGLYASTAGLKTNLVGHGQWEESLQILDGRIDDPSTLVVIFAADPDDDPFDEATWRKANPSLGTSPTLRQLQREASLAKDNPRQEAHFRRYHLNQWVDSEARWLNVRRWDECAPDPSAWRTRREQLIGRRCFSAFDISSTRDITAKVLLFPPDADDDPEEWPGPKLLANFWIPADTLAERVRNDRLPYDRWVDIGALSTTPGDMVDQSFMSADIEADLRDFQVERIGYDPWNATKLVTDLQKLGVDPDLFLVVRQGIQTLGEPSKHFERLVYARQLDHGGHPVLRWMAGKVVVRFDENMNYAPAKKRSAEKIDGIVAAVMATGLSYSAADGPAAPSPWDDPNFSVKGPKPDAV